MTDPAPLPTVARVEALPGHAARLTLEDGQAVTLTPTSPRVCLSPVVSGRAVLPTDWKGEDAPAYRVPAHLCAPLALALDLRRVEA